ncbi:ankyrin repeat domain-containing protein [Flavobacterium sp. I-SCBP12n]|uniref:Ankyrin repeat domain-containing protein n=1 Tax=Flavobacterium pygoscelis TaxID=2893176 RepID=A0A9X2BLI2_9FLAO|nr:ankyrin repeat domain-containing protein [Flavobacterium pygoscelis]MCK8141818.1 ankyrin repeat domain-containing protein [Flavobacterium pygoscelis]
MNSKYIIFGLVFLLLSCNRETKVDKTKLLGKDYRLFQDTPAWALSKAVEDEDIIKIREEVAKNKSIINFQESRFGGTLLMFAIYNNQYKSLKTLLELGANPNLKDFKYGTNAVIYAAGNEDPEYLKLVLKYGGNANSLETAPGKEGDQARSAGLNNAISYVDPNSLVRVKLLVNAGADINYSNNGPEVYTNLPLSDAIVHDNMDALLYLLEKGADYDKILYRMADDHNVYILEGLRTVVVDLSSDQYKAKTKAIQFLKKKGLDYDKEPIPDYIIEKVKKKYPKDWKDYIKKY